MILCEQEIVRVDKGWVGLSWVDSSTSAVPHDCAWIEGAGVAIVDFHPGVWCWG